MRSTSPVTFPLVAPNGTQAAPSYTFVGDTTTGFYYGVGVGIRCTVNNTDLFSVGGSILQFASTVMFGWTSGGSNGSADVVLVRDAAEVLALKNSTNAQTFRVYGTTTGAKYTVISHSGTDGALDVSSGKLTLGGTATSLSVASDVLPATDNARSLGSNALRFLQASAINYFVYAAASDSVAQMQLSGTALLFGAGGSATGDTQIGRGSQNGAGQMAIGLSGTLISSPADYFCLSIQPQLGGAFTVTRLSYIKCIQPGGASTTTDAAALSFDAAVGTHKALASSAAVGVTIGSGPTGSTAGNPQGWIKVNINGTLRFVPFW